MSHATVLGHGPAVVLLHGQPGSAAVWNAVTPLLIDRYQVIVPDRPGYGRNQEPAAGLAANTASLLRSLDDLGVARAVLVGHSGAGAVALHAAEHFPHRIAGLVLVGSVGPEEAVGRLDRLLAHRPLGDALTALAFAAARQGAGERMRPAAHQEAAHQGAPDPRRHLLRRQCWTDGP